MKLRKPLIITAIALTGLVAGGATASADPTATTFALTGGPLALTVEANATLTNEATGVPINVITGTLGLVSVDDTRGGTAAWTASASSTSFTGVLGSESTSVTYTAGVVAETGTITVADGVATLDMTDTLRPVVWASALSGNNTASWTPTLNVTMPAGALADTYSGTVTTSVA